MTTNDINYIENRVGIKEKEIATKVDINLWINIKIIIMIISSIIRTGLYLQ